MWTWCVIVVDLIWFFDFFDETLFFGGERMAQFFDKSSEEIHIDILAQLVQNKPIPKVTFCSYLFDSFSRQFVVCVANFN